MSDRVKVKIKIEDASAEGIAEVFRLVDAELDRGDLLPAGGIVGEGMTGDMKYSYTVTPVGGLAVGAETAPGCVRAHGPEVCCGETCTVESFVEADAAAWVTAHPGAGEVLMLLGRLVARLRMMRGSCATCSDILAKDPLRHFRECAPAAGEEVSRG